MHKIRFLHNIAGAPNVDIYAGKKQIAINLAYKDITSYLVVARKRFELIITPFGKKDKLFTKKVSVRSELNTFIIAGLITNLKVNLLEFQDQSDCPKSGTAEFRFIHAAAGVVNVDVYIDQQLVFANVKYGQSGTPYYKRIGLGKKTLTVNVAGTDQVAVGPVNFFAVSGGLYSVFASGTIDNPSFPVTGVFTHDNRDQCESLQEDFEIQPYMGKWFQIANIPLFFDRSCSRSTAVYTFLDNKVKVYNRCYNKEGQKIDEITGSAVPLSICQPASLVVAFPGFPNDPTIPNYLIHQTDYVEYALVGSPDRSSLYILSRKSKMTPCLYKQLVKQAKYLGYDTSKLVINYHALTEKC